MPGLKETRAQQYWVLSRQWRGDPRFGAITIGELITKVTNLAGDMNSLGWQRCENLAASLLSAVINNRRCRKRKPTNNIIVMTRAPRKIATQATPPKTIETVSTLSTKVG